MATAFPRCVHCQREISSDMSQRGVCDCGIPIERQPFTRSRSARTRAQDRPIKPEELSDYAYSPEHFRSIGYPLVKGYEIPDTLRWKGTDHGH